MLKTSVTLYVSDDFKTLLTRGNKYEDFVLEIMNKSTIIFPKKYKKVEEQSNSQPDFVDEEENDFFDAKLVVSEEQCKKLCGYNNVSIFFEEIRLQNNDIYDSIIKDDNRELQLEKILKKQLCKDATKNKNIIFFFTFPIGSEFARCVTSFFFPTYMTVLFSKIAFLAEGRRIIGICPTLDDHYEIRELGKEYPEFVEYFNLDRYYKWMISGIKRKKKSE